MDSIVTDPPYELGFMGKNWDRSGVSNNVEIWKEALRVLKPGGHLLAFSGSRTYHRMTCAIEDAGFEIRDQIMWVYGSGFPKSLNVSKAIDKASGAEREIIGHRTDGRYAYEFNDSANRPTGGSFGTEDAERIGGFVSEKGVITAPATDASRQWDGWGTALKPSHEPICVARKPLIGTVVANVLEFGTGAINVSACLVEEDGTAELGRWPANFIHDGLTEEWSRFFYCPKVSKRDRDEGNTHPTVKPTDLMAYLVRLVTPPSGVVLDLFMGSGSTGKACMREGFNFIGIDLSLEYLDIARARIESEIAKVTEPSTQPDLFAEAV